MDQICLQAAVSYPGHSHTLAATTTASCRHSVLTAHDASDQSELSSERGRDKPQRHTGQRVTHRRPPAAHQPPAASMLLCHCLRTRLHGVVQPVEEMTSDRANSPEEARLCSLAKSIQTKWVSWAACHGRTRGNRNFVNLLARPRSRLAP